MKVDKFVKTHISTLEHFIESGAWPLLATDFKKRELLQLLQLKAFKLDSNNRLVKVNEFNPKLLVAFYKFKYNEINKRYEEFYSKINKVMEGH
jgi:hypothetical protein